MPKSSLCRSRAQVQLCRRVTPLVGLMAAVLSATGLAGCAGHGSIDYDNAVRSAPGTITISDAKVFSREMLINERAADIAWIDRLITASEDPTKVSFKPTLIREMEEIAAFSATLGVRYDPAAAVTYRRANETGDIQHQIDVLKAQIQLEQLRRDIEIIRSKLPEQTELANSGLGTLGATTPAATTPGVTPPDASQVAATVNSLITGVLARLDAEAKPIAKTEAISSPLDDFRDRLAYRDALKSARNAAGLDELHDAGNNRLVRLNLQATVMPDPKNLRALGAIQISIRKEAAADPTSFLGDWLRATNVRSDWRIDASTFRSSETLDALENSGDFARTRLGSLLVLLPILTSTKGGELTPTNLFIRARWDRDEAADRIYFGDLLARLSVSGPALEAALEQACRPGSPFGLALDVADARMASYSLVQTVNLVAADLGAPSPSIDAGAKRERAENFQREVISLMGGRPGCASLATEYAVADAPTWRMMRRPEFGGEQQVRIYEVGPREQAQQVSTVARSANSLAMAASLAASAPSSGAAGNFGAGYRRDVMNRASALDRVPQVVGYSVGGQRTFGWLIGPQATTDSRGRAEVRQVPKSYDLTVDLSVPYWWRAMQLEVTTVWAPSPLMLAKGSLTADDAKGGVPQQPVVLTVPLTAAVADYQAFTLLLAGDSRRPVNLEEVVGGPVTGCAPTVLLLKGRNVWRAEKVMLLGLSLGRDAFVIAPDMGGIIVTVPAVSATTGASAFRRDDQVRVLTPLGEGKHAFSYDSALSGDACKAKPAAPEDPAAVTVSKAAPTSFVVPSLVSIEVTGTNLKRVDEVRLDGRKGKIVAQSAEGTSLSVEFSRELAEGIEQGTVKLEFFAKTKAVGTAQSIRIVRD